MSAAARPPRKRAATSSEDVPGPSKGPQKKTRFVEPQDDPVNFAEEVDANLETRQRRGHVKTEGYESDSSDDGEGVVPSRRPGADKAAEDEDEECSPWAEESGKKEQKFLRLGDIEGQEFHEQTSDRSETEDEPVDEDDAEQRKKAEGKFAEDGTYVRTFDPHAAHDRWMEGLDETEIKKARRNHRLREREQRQKQKAEEEEMQQMGGRPDIEKQLAGMLKKGETVLEALQRFGAQAKNSASKRSGKPNNKRKGDFADSIQTYEELVRSVRSSGNVDPSWVPPSADVKFEYKWAVPDSSGQDGQVFGPFGEEELQVWFKAGYFGTAGEKVQVRKVMATGEHGTKL
ncbi:uncharacterized protein B0H18DRAFT_1082743 [Fomitopsis serialis]|uniref:uncharacterized protein n=1 Tax=Fomitopsis serialis TaxID=139415 RepID=UPI002007A685|nr:uncharacterized protein B0H18DRAFT_1082743 [Neoantrodia serialis]KAH9935028.1 hypothetical protein B0H18DRAFT_1082743 [Neoantrodia serialis]